MARSGILFLLLSLVVCLANAYIVEVSPKSQECFFEELDRGERMIASFEVLAGGMLDINVRVIGPDSKTVYETERDQDGSFQFAAVRKGIYQVCFNNAMSTMTSKIISFNIYSGGDLHQYQNAKSRHMQPLDRSIATLTESVRQFVDNYHYLRGRILTCHNTAVSSNSRVFWWGLANSLFLVLALYVKTALTKRPFDKRKAGYTPMY